MSQSMAIGSPSRAAAWAASGAALTSNGSASGHSFGATGAVPPVPSISFPATPPRSSTSDTNTSNARSTTPGHDSMAEPELLALIIEMRLRAGRGTTTRDGKKGGGGSASSSRNTAAVDTMDLCHRKIQKLPEEMVDVIKEDVVRLALGYNFITALPSSFVDLNKLRYLNVRANLMTTFPSVLCSLPSLEILDMSRNKIRKLPDEPGRLSELRVLSLSNNRLRKIPVWFAKARHLRILKLESNPVSWPPPHISTMPPMEKAGVTDGADSATAAAEAAADVQDKDKQLIARKKAEDKHMLVWISKLKAWIDQNKEHFDDDLRGAARDVVQSPIDAPTSIGMLVQQLPAAEASRPENTITVGRESLANAVREVQEGRQAKETGVGIDDDEEKGNGRDLGVAAQSIAATPASAPTQALSEAVPATPVEMPVLQSDTAYQPLELLERPTDELLPIEPIVPIEQVNTQTNQIGADEQVVSTDKSLPAETSLSPEEGLPYEPLPSAGIRMPTAEGLPLEESTPASQTVLGDQAITMSPEAIPLRRIDSELTRPDEQTYETTSTSAIAETERNSYFRRLSTLPAPVNSVNVSVPVLLCIDATRGVLYALSQMHTALRQYVTFATDERMTAQLSRILDIAGQSMVTLIQSLDSFDTISRARGNALEPSVVRDVLVACVESIATFRKLVHVFQLQMPSLQRGSDVRYARSLLLLLYGSMSEMSHSWTVMEPQLEEVASYLSTSVSAAASTSTSSSTPQQHAKQLQPGLPIIAEATPPVSPIALRTTTPSRQQRRRQAGSFSAQDLAHGASMSTPPSGAVPASAPPSTMQSGEETRTRNRFDSASVATSESRTEPSTARDYSVNGTLVGASQTNGKSHTAGSASKSRRTLSNSSTPNGMGMYSSGGAGGANDPPIDDHLLQLVVRITSVAFSVWAGIEDHLVSLGLPPAAKGMSIKASNNGFVSSSAYTDDGNDAYDATFTPRTTRRERLQASETSTSTELLPETPDRSLARTDADSTLVDASTPQSTAGAAVGPSPAVQRRLRQLHDLTRGVNEHTHRLHACLERAQDAIGRTPTPISPPAAAQPQRSKVGAASSQHLRTGSTVSSAHSGTSTAVDAAASRNDGSSNGGGSESGDGRGRQAASGVASTKASNPSRELFVESNHFIKSILQISHYIKGLASERFMLPKYVKASMAELTTCARDLTLHLHFLSGPLPASSAAKTSNVVPHTADVTSTFAAAQQPALQSPAASAPAATNTFHQQQQA